MNQLCSLLTGCPVMSFSSTLDDDGWVPSFSVQGRRNCVPHLNHANTHTQMPTRKGESIRYLVERCTAAWQLHFITTPPNPQLRSHINRRNLGNLVVERERRV